MLDEPGDPAAVPERNVAEATLEKTKTATDVTPTEEETREMPAPSVWTQILLIVVAGVYLAGMIWLYIKVPALALLFVGVGAAIFVHGYVQHFRKTRH